MVKVATSLNVPSVFLYTPTALVVSLGGGIHERTYVRRIEPGDVLIIDTGAVRDGYFSDFDRNWAFGHASEQTKAAYPLATGRTAVAVPSSAR